MPTTHHIQAIMNRFLNKKKTKKAPVEQKPELDLAFVLPSSDDFRTSLIMPNLSARFSMLREQDDPNSKIGKASDDSVLHPTRQSRMLDFGFASAGLNDIQEVASVHGSVRPPYSTDKHGSFASEEGYGTDTDSRNGSVMSRARPVEGNNLFGGRQKVYKIPHNAAKTVTASSSPRALYDDDIHLSTFQTLKRREKAAAAVGVAVEADETDVPELDRDSRPSLGDSELSQPSSGGRPQGLGLSDFPTVPFKNEANATPSHSQSPPATATNGGAAHHIGTAISTGPAPSPPAVSQAPTTAAPMPAKRRLYDQGLERNLHEQQASSMTRFNTIHRQRGTNINGSVMSPPQATWNERPRQNTHPGLVIPSHNMAVSGTSSPAFSYPQSPASQLSAESDQLVLQNAIDPSDRGKATAMGNFNKPRQHFDEDQYLQRQMQLKQGMAPTEESRLARFDSARQTADSNYQRSRSASGSASGSMHTPAQKADNVSKAFAVFQNAASQNRAVHESPRIGSSTEGTFLADISPSDGDDDDGSRSLNDSVSSGQGQNMVSTGQRYASNNLSSVAEVPVAEQTHRAAGRGYEARTIGSRRPSVAATSSSRRPSVAETMGSRRPSVVESMGSRRPSVDDDNKQRFVPLRHPAMISTATLNQSPTHDPEGDSPTISSQAALGGMIHQHLRSNSGQSSIYPPMGQSASNHSFSNTIRDASMNSLYSGSNWEMDQLDHYYAQSPDKLHEPHESQTRSPLGTAEPFTAESEAGEGTWQSELKKQHARGASTGTQAERDAFDNELAARQRAIQEKMRSIVETDSRGVSPAPTAHGATKAFGMLKPKPSHESMARPEQPSKAMKMLGLGLGIAPPAAQTFDESTASPNTIPPSPQWPLPSAPREKRSMRDMQQPQRIRSDGNVVDDRHPSARGGPFQPSLADGRSVSESHAPMTTRSRSHSRVGRDVAGESFRDNTPMPNQPPPAVRQSPEVNSGPFPRSQSRLRSASRSGYMDSKTSLHPITTGNAPSGRSTPGGLSPGMHSGPSSTPTSPATFDPPMSVSQRVVHGTNGQTPPISGSTSPSGLLNGSVKSPPMANSQQKGHGFSGRKRPEISEPTLISSTSNIETVERSTIMAKQATLADVPHLANLNRRAMSPYGRDMNEGAGTVGAQGINARNGGANGYGRKDVISPPPSSDGRGGVGLAVSTHGGGMPAPASRPNHMRSQESLERQQGARFDTMGSPVLNEAGMF